MKPTEKRRKTKPEEEEPQEEEGAFSLAFPSFGTGVFQYDIERAAQVACKAIATFLDDHDDPRIRLFLVDITDSPNLAVCRKHWKSKDSRFQIKVANITTLKSSARLPCRFIANATNEWFSAQGSGVNLAINKAAGPALDKDTKARFKGPARAGCVYPVPLLRSSPLRAKENVHWVIHVMAPNMNPHRSNCLQDDYTKGDHLLGQCYSSLFSTFWEIISSGQPSKTLSGQGTATDEIVKGDHPRPAPNRSANAFSMLMTSAKEGPQEQNAKSVKGGTKKNEVVRSGAWSDALVPYITHPDKFPPTVMHQYDEKMVCIYDKFPKAFKHLLIIPRKLISGYSSLTADDLPILEEMQARGQMTVEQLTARYPTATFRLGF